ncbi:MULTISPECIES: CocE/NonD family hydrolase [unclassified Arthrobacter]|uniref:CocE/NonD family hydrolase n=1 Tax=unclassified Arthrobacter TaxID=235627 RepID=UPI001C85B8A8|nr:CocE/NonD family hydrolase [Arthrobacter sp. MAHUQ-56]MBX7445918.1 CocE/NonD family hydrolase [Arthrobacter sp. MAHUQ-56]
MTSGVNPVDRIWKDGVSPSELGLERTSSREVFESGMRILYDAEIPMRDGVTLRADIFLPESATDVPVIVGWSAYGKDRVPAQFFPGSDVDPAWISDYCVFEAPDPVYWTSHGYAIAYPNPRGTWYSGGQMRGHLNKHEAQDIHDTIEWLGTQPWSNGRVGMSGVSYFAIVQWFAAATRPPHLAAISPWEGFADRYREAVYHGGIFENGLNSKWWTGNTKYSTSPTEDGLAMIDEHPLFDDYWDENRAELERVDVPAYVVASWSDQGLHTRGTIDAFNRIGSQEKWLEVHGQKKWEYQFRPENVDRLREFFDHFLKGDGSGDLGWPRVRYEVRDEFGTSEWKAADTWPLPNTDYAELHLDAATASLRTVPVSAESDVVYEVGGEHDRACFEYEFDRPTEMTGHAAAHLWVEALDSDDLDLFVALDKISPNGTVAKFGFFSIFDDGPVALGWLRASHRALDETESKPYRPVHKHTFRDLPGVGNPVEVQIEIWPSSTSFEPGDRLRLTIAGRDTFSYPPGAHVMAHTETINKGRHRVLSGGEHGSRLIIPVVRR